MCNFLLYIGKRAVYNEKYSDFPISSKEFYGQFFVKGYCVTVDNWYMSPELADTLIKKQTDIYGTVKSRRKNLPQRFSKGKLRFREKLRRFNGVR